MKPSTVLSLFFFTRLIRKKIMNVWSMIILLICSSRYFKHWLSPSRRYRKWNLSEDTGASENQRKEPAPPDSAPNSNWKKFKINIQTAWIGRLPCTCNSTTLSSHIHFKWFPFSFLWILSGFLCISLFKSS